MPSIEGLRRGRRRRAAGARARRSSNGANGEYEERRQELGVSDELAAIDGLTPGMLVALGEKGIKTLDDFADLAGDELVEMLAASDKGGAKLDWTRPTR